VGTSLIAAALLAFDDDLYIDGAAVDVLVCRSTVESVTEAQRAAATAPYPPVLAVVADLPAAAGLPVPPPEVSALTRMNERLVAAQIGVPFVTAWRCRPCPERDAELLLSARDGVPAWLGGFAAAVARLIDAIEGPLAKAKVAAQEPAGSGFAA
jgi:hypothetical protein